MNSRHTHSNHKKRINGIVAFCILLTILVTGLSGVQSFTEHWASEVLQSYDRQNLQQFFTSLSNPENLIVESIPIRVGAPSTFINTNLLGLRRDRLGYVVRSGAEVVAIVVPATAEDGFNGYVDLLVAVDMTGYILAARVIRDLQTEQLHGTVDVIDSQWMKEFDGNAMRDIRQISWQTIEPDNEYDQFVGASVTPKSVSDRIYEALVFVQSNRIALMQGGS